MTKRGSIEHAQERAANMLDAAGITITPDERRKIEIATFGLNALEREGLEIVVYVNTERYCAKELVMFSRQTCPEHRHPPVGADPGKMETFRVRSGVVWRGCTSRANPPPPCRRKYPPAASRTIRSSTKSN